MESPKTAAGARTARRPSRPWTAIRPNRKNRFTLAILVILLAFCVDAAVYRWVDENGRVHFGDRPPADQGTEIKLRVPPSPPTASPDQKERRELQQRMLDIYREDREAKRQAREKALQEEEKRKENCREAEIRLEYYTNASGIYERDDTGNRAFLSFEERERYIEELKRDVTRWCDQ